MAVAPYPLCVNSVRTDISALSNGGVNHIIPELSQWIRYRCYEETGCLPGHVSHSLIARTEVQKVQYLHTTNQRLWSLGHDGKINEHLMPLKGLRSISDSYDGYNDTVGPEKCLSSLCETRYQKE